MTSLLPARRSYKSRLNSMNCYVGDSFPIKNIVSFYIYFLCKGKEGSNDTLFKAKNIGYVLHRKISLSKQGNPGFHILRRVVVLLTQFSFRLLWNQEEAVLQLSLVSITNPINYDVLCSRRSMHQSSTWWGRGVGTSLSMTDHLAPCLWLL